MRLHDVGIFWVFIGHMGWHTMLLYDLVCDLAREGILLGTWVGI